MEELEFFTINVEQTDWQTSESIITKIRHTVFVDEQHVPAELDIDQFDPQAIHWLAYDANDKPIATARMLTNGHIGRMAVLGGGRNKGVGSAVLRQIIRLAEQLDIAKLQLDAQEHAMPFYQGAGFEIVGEPFMEAGISHVKMALTTPKKHHLEQKHHLPNINEEQRLHKSIDGLEIFLSRARKMAGKTERCIRIFTDNMNPEIYNDKQLCHCFFELASRHPNTEIKILLKDSHLMRTQRIELAELAHKLSSHVSIRQLNKHFKTRHNDFLVFDNTALIYQQELRRYVGYSVDHAPLEALQLIEDFDQLWDQSQPEPEARRLHI